MEADKDPNREKMKGDLTSEVASGFRFQKAGLTVSLPLTKKNTNLNYKTKKSFPLL